MQTLTPSFILIAALAMTGCANQSAESQLTRKKTVNICQSGVCTKQSADTQTFQPEPVDAAAEQRLQQLIQLAEQEDNPKAAHDLGLRLLKGDGVARDSYQGIQWLRKAGDRGDISAQLLLGKMYLSGYEEMGPDFAEAHAWLSRAATQGSEEASQLISEAQDGRMQEREKYQLRKDRRDYWHWNYHSIPYYWHWHGQGWHLY